MPGIKEKLDIMIEKEAQVPTLPEVGIRAMQIALDDRLAQKKLVKLIMRYPEIAARVIHLANSPLFGLSGRVSSIERAVNLLGIAPVRSLVLSISVLIVMNKVKKLASVPLFRRLQDNAFACGIAARLIAEAVSYDQPDEAFLTGLLCNIGYFFILIQLEDERDFEIIRSHLNNPLDPEIETREEKAFGYSHARLGARVSKKWLLPSFMIEAIANHHTDTVHEPNESRSTHLTLFMRGAILLNNLFDNPEGPKNGSYFQEFLANTLHVPKEKGENILVSFNKQLSEESALFKLPTKPRKGYVSLLQEGNAKLYEISLEHLKTVEEKKRLLREKEGLSGMLEALFNHSPDTIVALDGEGRLIKINDSVEKLIDIPAEDFRSGKRNILDYYPPGLAGKLIKIMYSDRHGPKGVIEDFEAEVLSSKGDLIPVSFSGSVIEKDGNRLMSIGFLRDIRHRKALRDELFHARRYLSLLFDTITDGVRVINRDMVVEFENKSLIKMLGEGIGRKCFETHFHQDDSKREACADCPNIPFETGRTHTREVRTKEKRVFLISSATLEDKAGQPAMVQVIKDITALKEQERASADEMQLKAVMELAGATAHELNQPLTVVTTGLELISRQIQNRRAVSHAIIKTTLESVEKMSGIIRKLSEITQYETRSYLETMKILDISKSSNKN
ncbi:MAG: HDOD domain-containing protein [Nitrospiraceae bacterium]|nr:HDOD domain-containing protein [Nitrospiraceae bacterium]